MHPHKIKCWGLTPFYFRCAWFFFFEGAQPSHSLGVHHRRIYIYIYIYTVIYYMYVYVYILKKIRPMIPDPNWFRSRGGGVAPHVCNWAPPKGPRTSSEAPHVGLGAEARIQPYVGAIAAAAALSCVKWPVLWLHHHRRARMPGATGPYLQKAHPRHHTSLSPLPWKQQAN